STYGLACGTDYDNLWVIDHPVVAGAIPDLRADESGKVLLMDHAEVYLPLMRRLGLKCPLRSDGPRNMPTSTFFGRSLKAFRSTFVEDLGSYGQRQSGQTQAEAVLYRYIVLLKELLYHSKQLPEGLQVLNTWGLSRLQGLQSYRIPESGWHMLEVSWKEWELMNESVRVRGELPALHWSRRNPLELSKSIMDTNIQRR
ncbi:hypothetical protein FOL47_002848, partial [Perkinsus chesapeaki]